jgi:hypothetical protein
MAARVSIMMNDPIGNLRYCFTPLAAYIADTPELSLMACTGPKAFPFTIAMSKNLGDLVLHPLCLGSHTLTAIQKACKKCSPTDYKAFLNIAKELFLNSVIEPFWEDWLLLCPSLFFHPESLHHFLRFSWDHDVKWCIEVVTPLEIDF